MGVMADDRVFYKMDERLRVVYGDIGKKYYAEIKKAGTVKQLDEEYQGYFAEIAKIEGEKDKMEAKQLAAQGKRRCPDCRSLLPIESRFCNMCGVKLTDPNEETKDDTNGEPVEEASKAEPKKCIYCGTEMESDAVFCPNCGQKND
ncbi:MAG: zinc ribbon domain-containing protein [Lachnospiraceae bacterium]|nr:zinc ribbon domain-containing protein [Lachnospiraceae bacterium]